VSGELHEVRTVGALVRATHPIPALGVTILIGAITAARGAGASTLIWVLASTGAGQASVGWSNDYLDRELDAAAGRLDKPLVRGEISPRVVWLLSMVAFVACILLSFPLGLAEALVMLVAVSSAWSYNAGLKRTPLSWLPYAVSFGLAPVYLWVATSNELPAAWVVAGAALLGVSAHLLNVIPDLDTDQEAMVRGLPHRIGLRGSLLAACGILTGVLALVLLAGRGGGAIGPPAVAMSAVAVGLIGGVAWSGLRGRGRLGFRLTILAAAAIVGVFLLLPAGRA
jgi:4-hydroxybenzoate polyprenyltransferase